MERTPQDEMEREYGLANVARTEKLLREAQDARTTYTLCLRCGGLVECRGVPCMAGVCACGETVIESEMEVVDPCAVVATLLEAVQDLVNQHCTEGLWPGDIYPLHSGHLTANAEALRVLAKHKRVRITKDDGNRGVSAVWTTR